jgi:AraC-like DNA-binding protein
MATATTLLDTDEVYLGEFRQPPDDPGWAEENQVSRPIVALSADAMWLVRAGRSEPELVNPNHVVIHQQGDEYRRVRFEGLGYRCLFMYPTVSLIRQIASEFDPAAAGDDAYRIPIGLASIDAAGYSLSRRLARYLQTEERPDPMLANETAYRVLRHCVAAAFRGQPGRPGATAGPATARAHAALVEGAKAVMTARFSDRLTLNEVARSIHASPYHLARVFRNWTGYGLHGYVQQLRLRAALERLRDGDQDMARIALELGFSSHSHLSASFRRTFGITPSGARAVGTPPWAA